jgi:hypothetical protein
MMRSMDRLSSLTRDDYERLIFAPKSSNCCAASAFCTDPHRPRLLVNLGACDLGPRVFVFPV